MDARQAEFLIDQLASSWESELPATCAVLEAVPDDRRDYTPDAKSRTAWQLVTHIATSDIWFVDCVINGQFAFDKARAQAEEAAFKMHWILREAFRRELTGIALKDESDYRAVEGDTAGSLAARQEKT